MYKDVSFVFKTHPRGVLKRKELHARIKDAKITSNFSCVTPHHHSLSIYGSKGTLILSHKNLLFYKHDALEILKLIDQSCKYSCQMPWLLINSYPYFDNSAFNFLGLP